MITTRFISSLEKIFQDIEPKNEVFDRNVYLGEPFSFQFCLKSDTIGNLYFDIESDAKDYIQIHKISYVPALLADYVEKDDYRIFTERSSTYYPDILDPRPQYIRVVPGYWVSLWVTVKAGLPAGQYKIRFRTGDYYVRDLLSDDTFTFSVSGIRLLPCDIPVTCWIYYDCIAAAHRVQLFSHRFFKILKNYLKNCVSHGINTVFVPLVSHPRRDENSYKPKTVQLLEVEKKNGKYLFDFSKLEVFIDIAIKCGIKYFEFSHFASQQGVKYTPKIIGKENGEEKVLFHYDTPCSSREYIGFLKEMLQGLRGFLERKGIMTNCFFHVSDEPFLAHLDAYQNIGNLVRKEIPDGKIIDAVNNYEFGKLGILDYPVVGTNNAKNFLTDNMDIWVYYCCDQSGNYLSNRFFNFPLLRTRVIGVQLYLNHIKGFLHWAYNDWHDMTSGEIINPRYVADGGGVYPAGDCFLVYPGQDGPVDSIREEVFADGLRDYRALKTLEKYRGREFVVKLLEKYGFSDFTIYPHDEKVFMRFVGELHELIRESEAISENQKNLTA